MKKRNLTLSALFAAGLVFGSAMAAECQRPGQDGTHGHKGQRFKAADTDGNGTISLAEFEIMHAKRVARIKENIGDRFDPERAAKRPSAAEIFAKIDTDQSGDLTKQELHQAHKQRMERRQERGGKGGPERIGAPAGDDVQS